MKKLLTSGSIALILILSFYLYQKTTEPLNHRPDYSELINQKPILLILL